MNNGWSAGRDLKRSSPNDHLEREYASSEAEVSDPYVNRVKIWSVLIRNYEANVRLATRVAISLNIKVTSALKGFKMSATESMDIVDKLTAIDLKAATSAGEIAEGLAQFANIGSLMGVNID